MFVRHITTTATLCRPAISVIGTRSPSILLPHARLLSTAAAAPSRTALIKELRARTSAPMKKCVDALEKANNDVDEAVTILRKAGLAAAQKKAGRGASEGALAVVSDSKSTAAIVEINSETDFVARNEIFQELALDVSRAALGLTPPDASAKVQLLDVGAIGATPLGEHASVTEALGVAVSQLGENLVLRRACALSAPAEGGVVSTYVHNAYAPNVGRTAAAVVLKSTAADDEALTSLGQKLAMHVVAAQPLFLSRGDVDDAALQREKDILVEQAKGSGKPDNVIEKMVTGRMNKYYGEVCLLEQSYLIEEGAGSVAKVLDKAGKSMGAPVEIAAFVRYQLGEESGSADAEAA